MSGVLLAAGPQVMNYLTKWEKHAWRRNRRRQCREFRRENGPPDNNGCGTWVYVFWFAMVVFMLKGCC